MVVDTPGKDRIHSPITVRAENSATPMNWRGTTALKNAPMARGFQLSKGEAETIRKFLVFNLADIAQTIEDMAKDNSVSRADFKDAKQGALVITQFLDSVLTRLDASAAKPTKMS